MLGSSIRKIVILGNSLPRQCGIATFTSDLRNTLATLDAAVKVDVIAMSDRDGYAYPKEVVMEIPDHDRATYSRAANFINRGNYDVLSIQHEYGIFGGDSGAYLLNLIRQVRVPIVTTLHTVLKDPTPSQISVMDELLHLSARVVVMSEKAVSFLRTVHKVPARKIDLIHHGIHDLKQEDSTSCREELDVHGLMLLTFGLLSPDKGIQYVIEAMPRILESYPDATYVVVGATHPHIRTSLAGESYRESLITLAKKLGISERVRFVDRFVTTEELLGYLAAMDVYITPYLNPAQITSGTLAYSLGAGKAVISTPYWYAEELLAEGRGMLVPFRDSGAIAEALVALEGNAVEKSAMERRAADYGQSMRWPEVGKVYMESFQRANDESNRSLRRVVPAPEVPAVMVDVLPELKLDHLFDMTDGTGILQHATYSIPNRTEGYCVDDNCRALILTAWLEQSHPGRRDLSLIQGRYLGFVMDAFNPANGRFRNFMSYDRRWLEDQGSEDSHGRTMWSLGTMVNRTRNESRKSAARTTFISGIPALIEMGSPRTWAYGILAAEEYASAYPDDSLGTKLMRVLAARLLRSYQLNQSPDWPWFEQSVTYANARLCQALLLAGDRLNDREMVAAGIASLSWLMDLQTFTGGFFAPIGSDAFYVRGKERSYFDQQPVEAWGAAAASLCAARITSDTAWTAEANRAWNWFLGLNMLGISLADPRNGGCFDGLHDDRVNSNQGAESTLSYLCALTELSQARAESPRLSHVVQAAYEVK